MKSLLNHFVPSNSNKEVSLFSTYYIPTVMLNDLPYSVVSSFMEGLSKCGIWSSYEKAEAASKIWKDRAVAPILISHEHVKYSKNRSGISSNILTDLFSASNVAIPRKSSDNTIIINADDANEENDDDVGISGKRFDYDDVIIFNSRKVYSDKNKKLSRTKDVLKSAYDVEEDYNGAEPRCEIYPPVASFNAVRWSSSFNKLGGNTDTGAAKIIEDNEKRVELFYGSFMAYIIRCGFIIDGSEYVYFCTSSSGFKDGKHFFVKRSVFESSGLSSKIERLRKTAVSMRSEKWNVFRDEQSIALLTSNSVPGKFGKNFMEHVVIIDINDYPKLKGLTIHVDDADNFSYEDGVLTHVAGEAEYEQAPADGIIPVNEVFLDKNSTIYSVTNGNVSNAIGAVRGTFIKGFFQVFNFEKLAKVLNLDEFKVKDVFGVEHDIKDISMILDKNSFKDYERFVYNAKRGGVSNNFYDYGINALGIDDIYLVNVYGSHRLKSSDRKFNMTSQFIAPLKMTDEFLAVLFKRTFSKLDEFNNVTLDRFIELAKVAIGDTVGNPSIRSIAALADKSVNNGEFVFTDDIVRIVETYWYGIIRNAMKKNEIDGAALKAVPFIPDYFNALAGKEFILKDDCVVCKAFNPGETLLALRNPCVAFDHWIGRNAYSKYSAFVNLLNPYAIYTSFNSTLPKRLAADWDGDTINVTSNRIIVDTYRDTEKAFPECKMLNFAESKGSTERYNNTNEQRGMAVATSWRLNKVGMTAAIISNLFERLNTAKSAEERADIFNDIAVYGQAEQNYVDASKRGAASGIDYSLLKLSDDIYMDIRERGMVGKKFIVQSEYDKEARRDIYYCEYPTFDFDVTKELDADGFTVVRNLSSNFGKVFDYVVSKYPVFKYLLPDGNPTNELIALRDEYSQYAYLSIFSIEGNKDKWFKCSDCFECTSITRSDAVSKIEHERRRDDGNCTLASRIDNCKKMVAELVALNGEDIVYSYFSWLLKKGSKHMSLELFLDMFGDKAIALAKERSSISVIE